MSKKILVVDDDEQLRELTTLMIRRLGYTVESACGGEEALKTLDSGSFDVVITDFTMPGMNGVELLHAIRQRRPRMHTVLASGSDAIDSIPADAAVLAKPFSFSDLKRVLEHAES